MHAIEWAGQVHLCRLWGIVTACQVVSGVVLVGSCSKGAGKVAYWSLRKRSIFCWEDFRCPAHLHDSPRVSAT